MGWGVKKTGGLTQGRTSENTFPKRNVKCSAKTPKLSVWIFRARLTGFKFERVGFA